MALSPINSEKYIISYRNLANRILEVGTYQFGELGYENTSSWQTLSFANSYSADDNVYLIIYHIEQTDAWTNIYARGVGKVTGNSKNIQITNKGTTISPECTIYWALLQMNSAN